MWESKQEQLLGVGGGMRRDQGLELAQSGGEGRIMEGVGTLEEEENLLVLLWHTRV